MSIRGYGVPDGSDGGFGGTGVSLRIRDTTRGSNIVVEVRVAGIGTYSGIRIVVPGLGWGLTGLIGVGIRIGDGTSASISDTGEVGSFDETGSLA